MDTKIKVKNIHVQREAEFLLKFIVKPEIMTEFARILKPSPALYKLVG